MLRRASAAATGAIVGLVAVAVGAMAFPTIAQPHQAVAMHGGAFGAHPAALAPPKPDSTPVRLVIPAAGVDATVEARGLDSQRNLDTPRDFRDVAWYDVGPRPGQPGNAIINGHVNWWTGDAVFSYLNRLRLGDEIRVVRADGATVTFHATGKQVVDAGTRAAALFAPSTTATLTLITCSGVWNPLTQSDTQRLLVSAAVV